MMATNRTKIMTLMTTVTGTTSADDVPVCVPHVQNTDITGEFDMNALYASCHLCSRHCGVNRLEGKTGICGATATLKLGRAALHWWEEPCLVGDSGSGAVFFSFCSLHCLYCQNYELSHGAGAEITPERLSEIFLELQNDQHAANINLVTPGHYLPSIVVALNRAKQAGLHIPVVYNTSGYESVEALRLLDGLVDVYLTDYKYADPQLAHDLSQARDYPERALEALEEMDRQIKGEFVLDDQGLLQRGIIVRHLILPHHLQASKQALRLVHECFGSRVRLSIMNQFTPLAHDKRLDALGLNDTVSSQDYEEVLCFADDLGIEDYFWQEEAACQESFIPAFDGTGVVSSAN